MFLPAFDSMKHFNFGHILWVKHYIPLCKCAFPWQLVRLSIFWYVCEYYIVCLENCLFIYVAHLVVGLFILFSWVLYISSDPQCLLTNGKLPLWAKRLVSLPGDWYLGTSTVGVLPSMFLFIFLSISLFPGELHHPSSLSLDSPSFMQHVFTEHLPSARHCNGH